MSKEDNREKYKEYDHRYYIKHRRPNSKIGKLETKISDLEAKLAGKDQAIESLEELNRSLGQTCNNDRKEIERLRELISDKEKENDTLSAKFEQANEIIKNPNTLIFQQQELIDNLQITIKEKNKKQNQKAIDELENTRNIVEEVLDIALKNSSLNQKYYDELLDFIDEQINELKGINKTNPPTRR